MRKCLDSFPSDFPLGIGPGSLGVIIFLGVNIFLINSSQIPMVIFSNVFLIKNRILVHSDARGSIDLIGSQRLFFKVRRPRPDPSLFDQSAKSVLERL